MIELLPLLVPWQVAPHSRFDLELNGWHADGDSITVRFEAYFSPVTLMYRSSRCPYRSFDSEEYTRHIGDAVLSRVDLSFQGVVAISFRPTGSVDTRLGLQQHNAARIAANVPYVTNICDCATFGHQLWAETDYCPDPRIFEAVDSDGTKSPAAVDRRCFIIFSDNSVADIIASRIIWSNGTLSSSLVDNDLYKFVFKG